MTINLTEEDGVGYWVLVGWVWKLGWMRVE
jgi:hypothetical protein